MQDIKPINDVAQRHGLWEKYHPNGQLYFKGAYINGKYDGLWITYYSNGQLCYKVTFNMGQRDGLLLWFNRDGSIYEISFYAK
jgi:antitoxin component YwqK of YwqJK toxin-antitoxin module